MSEFSHALGATLDPALIRAYQETDYRVGGERPFVLHIDLPSIDLQALYRQTRVDRAAFLTACNPGSARSSDAENEARQSELACILDGMHLAYIDGMGLHPRGGWDGEPSFLVLGMSREDACAVGRRFGQNAVVWCGSDAMPRLLLLK